MRRARLLLVVLSAFTLCGLTSAGATDCGGTFASSCGVAADQPHGDFHGLIAISGHPGVFATAAHSGTTAGCGDCVWTLTIACPDAGPLDPNRGSACAEATDAPGCRNGVLERLYLSDAAVTYQEKGLVCLRPHNHLIPVGDIARADVQRYLKNVVPPDLRISTHPRQQTLAGLPTYFTAAAPTTLRPRPFGGGAVTETITMTPQQSSWTWGDGAGTGWIEATSTTIHRYEHGGTARGDVTTRWGATYTITFGGRTFGPYDAVGQLTKRQTFTLPVDTSSPVLVSHG